VKVAPLDKVGVAMVLHPFVVLILTASAAI